MQHFSHPAVSFSSHIFMDLVDQIHNELRNYSSNLDFIKKSHISIIVIILGLENLYK